MKKAIILLFVGILIVFSLVFVGCAKKEKVIKIGVITSLTGQSAKYGINALNGIKIAEGEINSKDGINGKLIKLIIEDDASKSLFSVSAFKKLSEIDGVETIIGPISSSSSMVCSPIANNLRKILFSPSAATPDFSSMNDFTFRNRVSAKYEIEKLAQIAFNRFKLKRIAILFVNNDYGLGNKNYFDSEFNKLGGKISIIEVFTEGSSDFRTQLTKIKKTNSDGYFIVGQGSEGGYILKQARELNIIGQFFSTITIQSSEVLEIAGRTADGVVYVLPTFDPNLSNNAKKFQDNYFYRYDKSPDLFAANGYDALYILAETIKLVGNNADMIRQSLLNMKDFSGVTGITSFDDYGDVYKSLGVKKIINGEFETIE